jgi:hypothetical protein
VYAVIRWDDHGCSFAVRQHHLLWMAHVNRFSIDVNVKGHKRGRCQSIFQIFWPHTRNSIRFSKRSVNQTSGLGLFAKQIDRGFSVVVVQVHGAPPSHPSWLRS